MTADRRTDYRRLVALHCVDLCINAAPDLDAARRYRTTARHLAEGTIDLERARSAYNECCAARDAQAKESAAHFALDALAAVLGPAARVGRALEAAAKSIETANQPQQEAASE